MTTAAATRPAALEQLAAAADDAARAAVLAAHPELCQSATVSELSKAVVRSIRKDPQEAMRLATAAVAIAEKLAEPRALAEAQRAKANALYGLGRHREAVEVHRSAAQIFESVGDMIELGRTLSSSIQPLMLSGDYDGAFAAAKRGREIFVAAGETLRVARIDINLGNVYHRQDRFPEALESYERAYPVILESQDAEGTAVLLHNMAVSFISVNDFRRAMQCYERARMFSAEHAMPALVAQADYNIAWLHYHRGEYSRAIDMLRETREACRRNDDAYHFALCHLDLSEIYLEINLSTDAFETAERGVELFRQLGMGYEEGKCKANCAIALGQQGKALRALEIFADAKAIFIREKNAVWPSLVELYEALLLFTEGRYYEARRACQSAFAFFQTSQLEGKKSLCLMLLARLHLKMRELDPARERCADALAIVARLDSPALTYHVHFLMGQIQLALGSRPQADDAVQKGLEAYASHQTARQALETLRSQLRGEELKIAFIKNKAQVYESLVDLSLRRGTPEALEEAFQHMEQAKSRTLLDAMCQSGAPQPVSGESELVRHIRDLREELNWYYHRIEVEQLRQEAQSPERLAQLQQAARSREDDLVRELRHMPETSIREAGLEPQAAVDLARIRESLPREATLVEYFCAGDRVLAAVLTSDDLQIYPVTLLARVENLIHLLQFQLGKFRLGQDYVQKFHGSLLAATNAHLAGLYRELIEPIRSRLKTDHIIVVPHGSLHHVPFHALAIERGYLIDELTVSYAPSASIFATCQAHPRSPRSGMAIFASPDANAPSIQEEASALTATLPGAELFLGPAATRAALQNAAENSRAIHIATHGHFRHDNPMFSGFRLGDGLVTLYDLRSFSLPVDLAVLSGCSTGMNAVTGGDELLGLERGLLSAGAATLLLSLWDVHDEATTSFMKSFYSSYLGSSSVIRGWADAIQHIRKSHPHPFYWAPFVVVGKLG